MKLYELILSQDDPFEYIYEAISGTHGKEAMTCMTELYSDVVVDCRYHPDDDFEEIISKMVELMEDENV
jgi:hypothetical protein